MEEEGNINPNPQTQVAGKVESYLSLCECCWKPLEGDVDPKKTTTETSILEILHSQVLSAKHDGLIVPPPTDTHLWSVWPGNPSAAPRHQK